MCKEVLYHKWTMLALLFLEFPISNFCSVHMFMAMHQVYFEITRVGQLCVFGLSEQVSYDHLCQCSRMTSTLSHSVSIVPVTSDPTCIQARISLETKAGLCFVHRSKKATIPIYQIAIKLSQLIKNLINIFFSSHPRLTIGKICLFISAFVKQHYLHFHNIARTDLVLFFINF